MKDNEKQAIEEMAKDVARSISWCNEEIPTVDCLGTAADLYGKGYRKQSEGEWKDNHCNICGMTPIGEETWTKHNITPPRFEWFMDFCPNCGAHMKGGDKDD